MAKNNISWETGRSDEVRSITKEAAIIGTAWDFIAVMLLTISAVSMVYTEFFDFSLTGGHWFLLALFVLALSVIRTVIDDMTKIKHPILIHIPASAAGAFLLFIFIKANFEKLELGVFDVIKSYITVYNRIYRQSIVIPSGDMDYASFSVLVIMVVLVFLATVFTRISRLKFPMLLIPTASISVLMMVGLAPAWWTLVIMLVGAYMLFLPPKHTGMVGLRVYSVLILCSFLVLCSILFGGASDRLIDNSYEFKQFEKKLEKRISSLFDSMFTSDRININNADPNYTDTPVLSITSKRRPFSSLYLKRQIADSYKDGVWYDDDTLEDFCYEYVYDVDDVKMFLYSSLYDVLESSDVDYNMMDFNYDYDSAAGTYRLLPYGAIDDKLDASDLSNDAIPRKSILTGSASFSGPTNNFIWLDYVSDFDSGDNDEDLQDFFDDYNKYVKEKYTEIPEGLDLPNDYTVLSFGDGLTQEEKISISISVYDKENQYRVYSALYLADMLKQGYVYSWDLDAVPADMDVIEYFLNVSHAGYCEHFATAAVLLLRQMGIPARYVSGYVVKPGDFDYENKEYTANLIDRNSHAWVEIYLDDIGWVPVEMTPGYGKNDSKSTYPDGHNMNRQDNNTPTDTPTPSPTDTPTPSGANEPTKQPSKRPSREATHSPTPAVSGTEKGGPGSGNGNGISKGLVRLFIVAAVILLAVAGVIGIIMKYNSALRQELENRYYRNAVRRINRRIYRRLRRRGKISRHVSDTVYAAAVAEFYSLGKKERKEFSRIVQKAAFSGNKITSEEADMIYNIYKKIR